MMDLGFEPSLEPVDYDVPRCPICGQECETIYLDKDGAVVGCDDCMKKLDAWEWAG